MKIYDIAAAEVEFRCRYFWEKFHIFAFLQSLLAAAVIRMFFHTLTEATFHEGMSIYLSRSTSNSEGVVEPENLYRALQQAIDEAKTFPKDYDNIQMLFESWEVNAGYPIVYVERSYNDRRIRFIQVRKIQFSPRLTLE